MEDPWAAGPSWSTPAKASASQQPEEQGRYASPARSEAELDVSDPWGAPDSPIVRLASPPLREAKTESPQQRPTWQHENGAAGWGEEESQEPAPRPKPPEVIAGTVPPSRREQDERGVWDLGTPPINFVPIPVAENERVPVSLPASPGPSTPPRSPKFPRLSSLEVDLASPYPFREDSQAEILSPMPNSPSHGEDGFGNFANGFDSGDPWGGGGFGGAKDEWVEEASRRGSAIIEERGEGEGDDRESWGGVEQDRSASVPARVLGEDDWEEAQRRIRLKQERAPQEKIEALQKEWSQVAAAVIGLNALDKLSEEEEERLHGAVKRLQEETAETLRSLSDVPPNINTHPPVISSLAIHERHLHALFRPNPAPTASLLSVSAVRKSRRAGILHESLEAPWISRSKLGEPDTLPAERVTEAEDVGKSRWSFWGRKAATEKALVSSGGGMLEVKGKTPAAVGTAMAPSPAPQLPRSSGDMKLFTTKDPSISPSPATSLPLPDTADDVGHPALSGVIGAAAQPAGPSVVSRFFGRLARKPSSQRSPSVDAPDLELSSDDFSFLADVPSIFIPPAEKGIGDLLSMESGRSEEIASLESMLTSRPAALPKPLAPPPKGTIAPSYSRTPSSSSIGSNNKFVPKMRTAATDVDLLGGLEFGGSNPLSASAAADSSPQKSTMSGWDDFLSSAKLVPAPLGGSSSAGINFIPRLTSGPTSIALHPSGAQAKSSAFSAFDDFDTPTPANNAEFDDFGDFSDFDVSSAKPSAHITTTTLPLSLSPSVARAGQNVPSTTTSTPRSHRPPALDHTPTRALMEDASTSKGQRWPAPLSPVGPALSPPPRAESASTGFPFLSPPPPPSRPSSGFGPKRSATLNADLIGGSGDQQNSPTNISSTSNPTVPPPAQRMQPSPFSVAPNPPRSNTPSAFIKPLIPASVPGSTKPGLSAQDLSFFDSL